MLSELEVRAMSARRTWAVAPVMARAIGTVFLYLIGIGSFREPIISLAVSRFGDTARDITPIALILPTFAIFLIPTWLAARYSERFKTVCPSCHRDVSAGTERILLTRCCPECGERIVEGGLAHSAAVYKRYRALSSRRFLKYWLWAWPALGGLIVVWQLCDRSTLQGCSQFLLTVPLIGVATAGWAWLRTSDRRYVSQLLASAVLFGLGSVLFWQAL